MFVLSPSPQANILFYFIESEISMEGHIVIHRFMTSELDLKGNELIVYAIIYGFSQDNETKFCGSRQYLADWCGCSVRSIQNILNDLTERGLLIKFEDFNNGVKICSYATNFTGSEKISLGSEKISPNNPIISNNILNNINNINLIDNNIPIKTICDFESIKDTYNSICTNLPKCKSITEKRRKAITSVLKKFSVEELEEAFSIANDSDFLIGKNDRGWKADLDFILREDKLVSILEGRYSSHRVNRVERGNITSRKSNVSNERRLNNGEF